MPLPSELTLKDSEESKDLRGEIYYNAESQEEEEEGEPGSGQQKVAGIAKAVKVKQVPTKATKEKVQCAGDCSTTTKQLAAELEENEDEDEYETVDEDGEIPQSTASNANGSEDHLAEVMQALGLYCKSKGQILKPEAMSDEMKNNNWHVFSTQCIGPCKNCGTEEKK